MCQDLLQKKVWFRTLRLVPVWSSVWYSQKKDHSSVDFFFLNTSWISLAFFFFFFFLIRSIPPTYSLSCLTFFFKTASFSVRSVNDLWTKSYIWSLLWSEISDRTFRYQSGKCHAVHISLLRKRSTELFKKVLIAVNLSAADETSLVLIKCHGEMQLRLLSVYSKCRYLCYLSQKILQWLLVIISSLNYITEDKKHLEEKPIEISKWQTVVSVKEKQCNLSTREPWTLRNHQVVHSFHK